jgi:hypothetical protein
MNSGERISSGFGQDWRELLINWSLPCPACAHVGILRTETESWYQCQHCGHHFSLERGLLREDKREQGRPLSALRIPHTKSVQSELIRQ